MVATSVSMSVCVWFGVVMRWCEKQCELFLSRALLIGGVVSLGYHKSTSSNAVNHFTLISNE